jgi:hypothetical protein
MPQGAIRLAAAKSRRDRLLGLLRHRFDPLINVFADHCFARS